MTKPDHAPVANALESCVLTDEHTSSSVKEELRKSQQIHYNDAAEVLRRHVTSGNFNSHSIFLSVTLADKYRSIDECEQEKLLLKALQMCDVVYPPNGVSEMAVSILCDLSDLYWDRSNVSTSSECYLRAFKMELELHSSDPYHEHIWREIRTLASYLLADSGNDEVRNFVKGFIEFIERTESQEITVTCEQKTNFANLFLSMSLLLIYFGDLRKSRVFYNKANEMFNTIEQEGHDNDDNSSMEIKNLVWIILALFPESPTSDVFFSQIFSKNDLTAQFFKEKLKRNARSSTPTSASKMAASDESYTAENDSARITGKSELLSEALPFVAGAIENLNLLADNETNDFDERTQEKQENTRPNNEVDVTHANEQPHEKNSVCEEGTTNEQPTPDTDLLQHFSPITSEINVLADSVRHDLYSDNIRQANETSESLYSLVVPFLSKYSPNSADFFIEKALQCKQEKKMDFMPSYLNLSAQLTSDDKKKAEIAKLMAESHFHSGKYKMATIQFRKAAAYYSCHSNSVVEYLETLLGLIRSHMCCKDLEEASGVCEKAIAFIPSSECGILKHRYEAEFLYLAAICRMKEAKMTKQITNTTFENVASYCQRAICVIEIAEKKLGPSDLLDELTGDVRGKLFTLKCEIQLLLATSFLKLARKKEADDMMNGMCEFLENISVVVQTFSEETWPEDNTGLSKVCRRIFSWIGRSQVLSGSIERAIGSLEKSILLFLSDYDEASFDEENFLDVLDAFTATKKVPSEKEIRPFLQTVQFCKEAFLEEHCDVKKLLIFLEKLARCYRGNERTDEAIVVYEIMLPIAECLQYEQRYSSSHVLLFLGSCHQKLALKSSGEKATDERRLAEKYYQVRQEADTIPTLFRKVEYLQMLSEENRYEEATEIANEIFEVGDEIWEMMVIYEYSSREQEPEPMRSYLSDHGELLTSVGCVAYSTVLRVFLQAGMKKGAVETFEKLSKQGHDVGVGVFLNRPSFVPYLLTYCQKELVSFLEKKDGLHFEDSKFPLTDESLAEVYYKMGEYDLALKYCRKTLVSVGATRSGLPPNMDLVQKKLDCLRLSGNASVLLGKPEDVYSYYISFLELLESQKEILKASFEEQQIILQTYDFAGPFFLYRSLGILLCRAGYVNGAIKVYEHCVENLTTNPEHGHDLVGTLAELYQTKAFTSLADDKTSYFMWMAKAKKCFENYFQSESNPVPFVETTFAALLYRLEEYDEAIVHLENVLQQSHESTIKFGKEDIPLVGAYLAQEIEAKKQIFLPIKIYVSFLTASAYKKLNDNERAKEVVCKMDDLCSVFKSDPNYPLIHSVLGYAYKVIGNDHKAAEIFQSVLVTKPDHAPVTNALQCCVLTHEHTSSSVRYV